MNAIAKPEATSTRIISFNVNGLRARLHQLQSVIDQDASDIIGLQNAGINRVKYPKN